MKKQEQELLSQMQFDPATNRKLTESELAARPKYPYKQELLWIPEAEMCEHSTVPTKKVKYPFEDEVPVRVWSVLSTVRPIYLSTRFTASTRLRKTRSMTGAFEAATSITPPATFL